MVPQARKNESSSLTAFDDESPVLELIDRAVAASREAAHACQNAAAREHFEFALALLRESWIAESRQESRSAEKVVADVKWGLRLVDAAFAKGSGQ